MVRYKVTLAITDSVAKAPRRGARETHRYRLLKLLSPHVSLATLRSLRIRRVA
jgi:hypothetical protein